MKCFVSSLRTVFSEHTEASDGHVVVALDEHNVASFRRCITTNPWWRMKPCWAIAYAMAG
ncbi:MAG: hypothetical protein ACLFQT_02525 [Thiohalophilus sp.]